jgi:DNA replication protein DnaC
MPTHEALRLHCKALRLPTLLSTLTDTVSLAEREGWTYEQLLLALFEQELEGRRQRRVQRLLKQSQLPADKTLAQFDMQRLPRQLQRILPKLCEGGFANRAENILFFGLPGTGKTHAAAAVGYELVHLGYPVLFVPTFRLVGRLLKARRDYELERELRRLDRFQVVILDDIGYVQQSQEEMEVLFTFLAERYERRSVIITSNLVFSQWDRIFKNPLTTAAAIDRVVHHSTIIEFGQEMKSVRAEEAAQRQRQLQALS